MTIPEITITLGWWCLPAILSTLSVLWGFSENPRNTGLTAGLHWIGVFGFCCFVWMIYFANSFFTGVV